MIELRQHEKIEHVNISLAERLFAYEHVSGFPRFYGGRYATEADNGRLCVQFTSGAIAIYDITFEQFVKNNEEAHRQREELAARQQAAAFQQMNQDPRLAKLFNRH